MAKVTEPNGNSHARLSQFYHDWKTAEQRLELARQSYIGAEADVLAKESRFKGAAELLYGKDATFSFNEKTGLVITPPNRATRRAIAKKGRKRAAVK